MQHLALLECGTFCDILHMLNQAQMTISLQSQVPFMRNVSTWIYYWLRVIRICGPLKNEFQALSGGN